MAGSGCDGDQSDGHGTAEDHVVYGGGAASEPAFPRSALLSVSGLLPFGRPPYRCACPSRPSGDFAGFALSLLTSLHAPVCRACAESEPADIPSKNRTR